MSTVFKIFIVFFSILSVKNLPHIKFWQIMQWLFNENIRILYKINHPPIAHIHTSLRTYRYAVNQVTRIGWLYWDWRWRWRCTPDLPAMKTALQINHRAVALVLALALAYMCTTHTLASMSCAVQLSSWVLALV